MPETPEPESFGDKQRQLAALLAEIAADERQSEEELRELAAKERRIASAFGIEPGGDHLLEMARASRAGIELWQRIAAAQAIAHDEMMAAGGPGNSEAYEQYRETTLRHNALMPRFEKNP